MRNLEVNEIPQFAIEGRQYSGHSDAVLDFDKVMADPAHPDHLRSDYDRGDHLRVDPRKCRKSRGDDGFFRANLDTHTLLLRDERRAGDSWNPSMPQNRRQLVRLPSYPKRSAPEHHEKPA